MPAATLATQSQDTTNTTSYTNTLTPAAGDWLGVFVFASGLASATDIGTLTDDQGIGFELGTSFDCTASGALYAFKAKRLAAAVSTTLTFDTGGTTATGCIICPFRLSSTGLMSVRQVGTNTGAAGTTPSVTMPGAILTTSTCIATVINNVTNPTFGSPTSWVAGSNTGYTTPTRNSKATSRDSGETNTTVTWAATSGGAWGAIIVEVQETTAIPAVGSLALTGAGR